MALIYFFRHGQAGTRDDYDRLSVLGQEQAAHLGNWIRAENLQFDRILCGSLRRQKETATIALGTLDNVTIDPRWSEFDLDAVYNEVAPQLAQDDPRFRTHWDELQRTIASGDSGIHRQWTESDGLVAEAWIKGRYATRAESWDDFNARVINAGDTFEAASGHERIAIFTSATPVSIWISHVLGGLGPDRIMRFAGAALNTGISILARRNGETNLFSFNAIPHLTEPRLRTFR